MSDTALIHGEEMEVPWSLGSAPPRTAAPTGAVDTHHHIFDPRFEPAGVGPLGSATVTDYRRFMRRLGLSRSVVVAASSHGTDNRGLIAALAELGPSSRGVVLVDPDVSDAELDAYHAAGVRGMRIYLAKNRVPTRDEVRRQAARAKARGWSLSFVGNREREVLVEWQDVLLDLPCPLVIDHFGWAPQPQGEHSATARLLMRLVQERQAYVKLSGLYLSSRVGFPDYSDLDGLAKALVSLAPDRLIWGSDWPHPMAGRQKPDGAMLFDRLAEWAPDPELRHRILVANPARLYWPEDQ